MLIMECVSVSAKAEEMAREELKRHKRSISNVLAWWATGETIDSPMILPMIFEMEIKGLELE